VEEELREETRRRAINGAPWLRSRTRPTESSELRFTLPHSSAVRDAAFSPDGTLIGAADQDGTVRIWDVETQLERAALGHDASIAAVAFSPDGGMLASGTFDGPVHVWDVAAQQRVATLTGHSDAVSSCAFTPAGDLLATASWDGTIRLWPMASADEPVVIEANEHLSSPVGSTGAFVASFSPDGRALASIGESDPDVRLWDGASGRLVGPESQGKDEGPLGYSDLLVRACAFSPDGTLLAWASQERILRLRTLSTGDEVILDGHEGHVLHCAFSPDGTLLASAGFDRTIRVWDIRTATEVSVLVGHGRHVWACVFSPDGAMIASASEDRTLKVWDVAPGELARDPGGHTDRVWTCAFSPRGALLATAGKDRTARLWDVATGTEVKKLTGHTKAVHQCEFSPDGRLLASAAAVGDGVVRVWNALPPYDISAEWPLRHGARSGAQGMAFSPDGTVLAVSSGSRIRLWDVVKGRERQPVEGLGEAPLAFSPDGTLLAASGGTDSSGNPMAVWLTSTGERIATIDGDAFAIERCAFSPDGKRLAWGQNGIRIWDTVGERELPGPPGSKAPISFSPDGSLLLGTGAEGGVLIWEAVTSREVVELEGVSTGFGRAAFTADGQHVVSTDRDRTVRLWNAHSGTELARLVLSRVATCLATHPSELVVGCGDEGGGVHVLVAEGT
jgi:WD40 repeat protein